MADAAVPTVRDVTRGLMRELGLTTVFGNPGTTEVPFLDQWPDDFRYVLGLQESVAAAMADGYAQQTGNAVLVNLHSAGGVGHALGAVFGAYRNRTPMIVLAGQQVRRLLPHDPFLGATEAPEFPKPYVKWSLEPARAADVPLALARAYQLAMQAPRGPVFLSVPADDWDEPGEPVEAPAPIAQPGADPAAISEFADALRSCLRPALVVGPAVIEEGAVREMVELAERTRAAVWLSPMVSRSSFPETHPQFAGFLQPSEAAVAADLAEYDLVGVFGAPAFTYHVFRGAAEREWPSSFLISDDPQILARAQHTRGIRAALGPALRQLLPELPQSERPLPTGRQLPELPPLTSPPPAEHVLSVLREQLPADAVVVTEAPTHKQTIQRFLPFDSPEQDFHAGASGALGYGISAVVGSALATRRPVVGVLGDGASMYGIQALWTAAQEHASLTVLVLDNEEYAAVRLLGEVGEDGKMPGVRLGGIDFVALAQGMGCAARRVDDLTEFDRELRAALAESGPTVLHVPVAPSGRRMY
ncbi:benzoylformate decarboxylase [Saccharopolyspora sp. SCSIO 74807]|uniref:benzoylformate decarboxylase n=2 Tax=unclassified Saccharopolyspora TaxID=2646250 RepID=UPI0030D0545B